MKAIYSEPMTKAMFLNLSTAICSESLIDESGNNQGGGDTKDQPAPMF